MAGEPNLAGGRPAVQALFVTLLLVCACNQPQKPAEAPPPNPEPVAAPSSVRFTDVTEEAGIRFIHNNGAFGMKYLPESLGAGCAFLDFDNDGRLDILLVNSKDWSGRPRKPSFPALYKNNGDGTFTDITRKAGLAVEMYGLGTAVGDYDNDGDLDILITDLESDRLFRNNGDGTFQDVTQAAGLGDSEFGTSAAWFDYDGDGDLDLYVCNYVKWSIETDLFCTLDGVNKSYCTPESYPGASPQLFRNRGNGTFEDATRSAGLYDPTNKALGVVTVDYDQDGRLDLFVANDTQPNKLYRNNGDGTFTDKAVLAGVAFSEAGVARAGMGVDAADYDRSGFPSLLVGNFSNEMIGLYHNEGTGLFLDEAPASTVGQASLLTLTFGAFFFDYDLDGRTDIFAANGHVHDDIDRVQPRIHYAQPPHLFRNLGANRFQEVTQDLGPDFTRPVVARGAAYGDYDNDGDLDILITTNGGPAKLLRNDGGNQNSYLRIKISGNKSNRDCIGAKIILHLPDGSRSWHQIKGGASYCSQSELTATFGLGVHKKVDRVEIIWPGGMIQKLEGINANQTLTAREEAP